MDPTPPSADYVLLDAGDGRRLERFGPRLVDRPAPGADRTRLDPAAWAGADLRYLDGRGWSGPGVAAGVWTVTIGGLVLDAAAGPSGGVGIFPEHAMHADWLAAAVAPRVDRPAPSVLHLFGHTGLLTLVAARAGAAVVHVDAARSAVARARANAARNDLASRPIRWLVDDAAAFVAREGRRGRRHDVIVIDPPTWGHGPAGRPWRLKDDLPGLLAGCRAIAGEAPAILLTAHTTGWDGDRLAAGLASAFAVRPSAVHAGPHRLVAASGAELVLGAYACLGR